MLFKVGAVFGAAMGVYGLVSGSTLIAVIGGALAIGFAVTAVLDR